MRNKLISAVSVILLLSACGASKSNLSGTWYFDSQSGRKVYAIVTDVDKDENVFACLNLLEKDLSKGCDVRTGKPIKVVSENKACTSNGVGEVCLEYHTESQTMTMTGFNQTYSKVK